LVANGFSHLRFNDGWIVDDIEVCEADGCRANFFLHYPSPIRVVVLAALMSRTIDFYNEIELGTPEVDDPTEEDGLPPEVDFLFFS